MDGIHKVGGGVNVRVYVGVHIEVNGGVGSGVGVGRIPMRVSFMVGLVRVGSGRMGVSWSGIRGVSGWCYILIITPFPPPDHVFLFPPLSTSSPSPLPYSYPSPILVPNSIFQFSIFQCSIPNSNFQFFNVQYDYHLYSTPTSPSIPLPSSCFYMFVCM